MTGRVEQVSVSRGGVPKMAVAFAQAAEAGLEGDAWRYPFHGGKKRAILLITAEGIEELAAQGFAVYPGALGENVTSSGLDRRALRIGQRYLVGEAEIELTQVRTPCDTISVYGAGIQAAMYDAQTQAGDASSPRWGLSGFYAAVISPGIIRRGDAIVLRQPGAGRSSASFSTT